MHKNRVSIIGAGECSPEVAAQAYKVGNYLGHNRFVLVCGGLGGVMEHACKGAYEAGGISIGILPGKEVGAANKYVTFPIATGLGEMRNYQVVVNGLFTVAISGGYGTLSEIAMARKLGKQVIALGEWDSLPGVEPAADVSSALELVEKFTARLA